MADFFLWTDMTGEHAGCGDQQDLARAAARAGQELVCCNLSRALPPFRKRFPDAGATFGIGGVASLAGLSIEGAKYWLRQSPPVAPPDAVPASGKGRRRVWSRDAAFVIFVLGGLSRRGVPLAALRAIYHEFMSAAAHGSRQKILA